MTMTCPQLVSKGHVLASTHVESEQKLSVSEGNESRTSGSQFGLFILEGDPFESPGVPVDALFELVTYRALIVDVAKQCFMRDHPGRSRSRRNMERDFDLRLVDVRPGSSNLLLERAPVSDLDAGEDTVFQDYFGESRDLVSEAMSEVGKTGRLPERFPPSSLSKFRNLGRTLAPGSRIRTARVDGSKSAYFTPETRDDFQRLIEQRSQISHQEVVGRIVEIDTERLVFHLRNAEGARIRCNYNWGQVAISHGWLTDETGDGPLVSVEGQALVDDEGDVQRFESVTRVRQFETTRLIDRLINQIQKFTELPNGWLGDDESIPVAKNIATQASQVLEQLDEFPTTLAPAPLPDGGLRFEWSREETDYVLELNSDDSMYMCVLKDRAEDDLDALFEVVDGSKLQRFLEEGTIG